MKKKWIWLLVAVFVIVAGILGGFYLKDYMEQKRIAEQTPIRLLAMGDSLTEGIGDEEKNGGYVGILERELKQNEDVRSVKTYNYGVSGNRIDQLLKRLDENEDFRSDLKKANVVTITIGGNDVMKILKSRLLEAQVSDFTKAEKNFQKQLVTLFSEIRTLNPDAPVFLVGIYNPYTTYFSQIKQLDTIISSWNKGSEKIVADEQDVIFVPVANVIENREKKNMDKPNPLLSGDYFHPNHEGYEKMAAELYGSINQAIQDGEIPK
ncbi:SGNH/GDSL hydrolase family protein [Listeria goaensis]|uniref:SGNH/GDSL hydrolase family protein n=1 Tax=Listeria goaensis TaxID=1649188 RepID=UPI000B597A76|nr:SGNH/GDSL hydrolase family protein [Listeria goaensis]